MFKTGLEVCIAQRPPLLEGRRFGLLMNRASVDGQLRLACDLLHETYPGQLRAIFTPQHGLWGDAQANMVETAHQFHDRLNVPVYSLYSETRAPTDAMLRDIDCLVIDLQDVGTRVYTFVWTVLECMRACARLGVSLLILDRPNPLGGRCVEGPMLQSDYVSFVGGAPIPLRHGLTIGELALFLKMQQQIDLTCDVVRMDGWDSAKNYQALQRTWIPPSPNLPTVHSAMVYPGQVLLEGTNLSEGRGTTTPFELFGAPYIDPHQLIADVMAHRPPGVALLPARFCPSFDKWSGQDCGGASVHITDVDQFCPVKTTLMILQCVIRRWEKEFCWLNPPYEYERVKPPIDIISGSDQLRRRAINGETLADLADLDADAWFQQTQPWQLYRRSPLAAGR